VEAVLFPVDTETRNLMVADRTDQLARHGRGARPGRARVRVGGWLIAAGERLAGRCRPAPAAHHQTA
jgi:hypothetical protein